MMRITVASHVDPATDPCRRLTTEHYRLLDHAVAGPTVVLMKPAWYRYVDQAPDQVGRFMTPKAYPTRAAADRALEAFVELSWPPSWTRSADRSDTVRSS